MDGKCVLAFAHRGDQDSGPENTMAAFEGAVRLGFRYIETDVHTSADGVLVIFHDHKLDRLTDQKGRIDRQDWAIIRHARVAGVEPIPTLEMLLGEFPNLNVNIEPKSDAAAELLVRIIRRTRAEMRVCLGSFSDARLRQLRSALPQVCTSMGRGETMRARLRSMGFGLDFGSANCALVPLRLKVITIVVR